MELRIAAFPRAGSIPKTFTADGADFSPALSWSEAPEKTRAFALIMDDPDAPAGLWTHWTPPPLPRGPVVLPTNTPTPPPFPNGPRRGKNPGGVMGHNGPPPPPENPPRFSSRLFPLPPPRERGAGATRQQVDTAMQGKILAEAEWQAIYGR